MVSNPPPPQPASEGTDYATEAEFIEAQRMKTEARLDQRLSKTGQIFFQGARKAFGLALRVLAISTIFFIVTALGGAWYFNVNSFGTPFSVLPNPEFLEVLAGLELFIAGLSALVLALSGLVYGAIVLVRFAQFSLSSLLWAVLSLGLLGWMFTSQNELLIPLGVFLAVQFVIVLSCWIYNSDPYVKQNVALDEFRRNKRACL